MADDLSELHRQIFAYVPDLLQVGDDKLIQQGLIAASLTLEPTQLVCAYQVGLFPWFNPEDQYVLWWFPPERMVLRCADFHVSKNFRKALKRTAREDSPISVCTDLNFKAVMQACAEPRPGQPPGTWISDRMIKAYEALHQQGIAHSVEVYRDDTLIGGLYGVSLGRMFYGESMFSREPDASKTALYYLSRFLLNSGVELIDCQQHTEHLQSLGAQTMPAVEFYAHIFHAVEQAGPEWRSAPLTIDGDYRPFSL